MRAEKRLRIFWRLLEKKTRVLDIIFLNTIFLNLTSNSLLVFGYFFERDEVKILRFLLFLNFHNFHFDFFSIHFSQLILVSFQIDDRQKPSIRRVFNSSPCISLVLTFESFELRFENLRSPKEREMEMGNRRAVLPFLLDFSYSRLRVQLRK